MIGWSIIRERTSGLTDFRIAATVESRPSIGNQGASMILTQIAGGDCGRDDCPTVFTTDRGTVAVQGYVIDKSTRDGESVVEIPLAVFRDAARAIGH